MKVFKDLPTLAYVHSPGAHEHASRKENKAKVKVRSIGRSEYTYVGKVL